MAACRWNNPECPGTEIWIAPKILRRAMQAEPGLSKPSWHQRLHRARERRVALPVKFDRDPDDLRCMIIYDRCQCDIDRLNTELREMAMRDAGSEITRGSWVQSVNRGGQP